MDFIRLYGCPVGCWYCDQGYGNDQQELHHTKRSIPDLISELQSSRVVVSGGEPMAHFLLPDLCEEIHKSGRIAHIETSGAMWQDMPFSTWVTLSPKEHLNSKYPTTLDAWNRADEIKLVISDGTELECYKTQLSRQLGKPVYLQPEWGDRERTIPLTLNLIKQNPTYQLSVQIHKYLGVY